MKLWEFSRVLLCAAALGPFCGILAQDHDPARDLPLDALLNTRISTAAKYEQRVTDIPASVTVITAEEIARNGWRTLAEALASVRGVTLTYDRGYSYLGVRGVGLPTDFNNRFLILLNGQPMLEGVSGSIDTGTALAISMSSLARIEFVRGPGSVLYGSGAMFGVINLVLKGEQENATASIGKGSHGLSTGGARFGHVLGKGFSMSMAAAAQTDPGQKLYFPEFDTPENNHGLSVGHDYDNSHSLTGTISGPGVRFLALTSSRTKGIPTAWYGTDFNGDMHFTDGRSLFSLTLDRRLSRSGQLFARTSYDRFRYHGTFPFADGLIADRTASTRIEEDIRYVWDAKPNHRFTMGATYLDSTQATYAFTRAGVTHTIGGPFAVASAYVQSDFQPLHSLAVTTGIRYDHYAGGTSATSPRVAVVWHASDANTLKVLYGSAFRLPTVFELEIEEKTARIIHSDNLKPERIAQAEISWESRLTPEILLSLSRYRSHITQLITQQTDPATGETRFQNVNEVISQGVEAQMDYRRNNGFWSYLSYSLQHADENGQRMVNSPSNLIKAGMSTPSSRRLQGALECQYETGRKTLAGNKTSPSFLTNGNLALTLGSQMRLSLTVRNLWNTKYSVPGGVAHPEDTIAQDRRTVLLRLRLGL